MMKHLRNLIAPVLAAVLAATMAQGAFYQWSRTSATNATADPTINWAEGMSPSSVNDSARAMMARAAEYRDDISGLLATAGSSTAYTVTTNQGLNSVPDNGQLLSITVHATNGAAVTLTADGGTSYPIWSAPSVPVPAATMVLGSPYTVKFSTTYSAWMLRDFYASPTAIPIGGIIPYVGSSSPNSNFILPYGQCISRTTYAAFFALVSTTYGVCDGVTTFAVPDLQGRTIAAIDSMGSGVPAGRLTATYFGTSPTVVGNVGGAQNKTILQANFPSVNFVVDIPAGNGAHSHFINSFATDGGQGGGGTNARSLVDTISAVATLPQMSGTAASGGSGTPMSVVQPTMVMNYLLRVL